MTKTLMRYHNKVIEKPPSRVMSELLSTLAKVKKSKERHTDRQMPCRFKHFKKERHLHYVTFSDDIKNTILKHFHNEVIGENFFQAKS